MRIAALKKDRQHLTRILTDNGEEILLDNDVCSQNALKCGTELSPEKLEELIFDSQYVRAKSRALWYLDRSDATEKGLYDKLVRAGFDKRASAKVIARLKEVGLIDDRRYAQNQAERLLGANVSKRAAVQKMLARGVPYDMAKEVLEGISIDEQAQINALIEKKYRNKCADSADAQKVFAALVRRGFSYSAVKAALKKYIEDSEFCEE